MSGVTRPAGHAERSRTPPGPPLTALPSLLRKLARDRLGMLTSAALLGDAVRVRLGPRTLYVFNHPDHARHVLADNSANYHKGIGLVQARRALGDGLLTSEGEMWRRQRAAVRPAFRTKRIGARAGLIAEEAATLVARLRARVGGGPVDVVAELTGLTLGVLGRTLLDADLGGHGSVAAAFEAVQDQAMFEMVTQGMVPMWLPLPHQRRFRRARAELERLVDRLVAGRAGEPAGDDALSRLLASARAESDPRIGRRRVRDELVTLLLAGHETTASTLGWTFHLLGQHPRVAARLRAEVVSHLGDRAPGADDLRGLPYATMVLQEALRLYPPVWILTRVAQDDDEVGGYRIPAGKDVLICPYTLHRHPRFWTAPERFDPERFAPGNSGALSPYAYLPFGAGPRFCVGSHLGMLEATIVLAMVMRELHLDPLPQYRVRPEPMLSLRIRGGLPMTVRTV
ncbi:cytochrome P450 [Actinomadura fibrosa]|uniref:Cytochrome P450 n=1 Tax=Actinomadura fibrosa TaxID=111802 RepID=A0ABW2Y5S1_9ACTN|nr:cytochrome P450 [Actinomadura fibrosa]